MLTTKFSQVNVTLLCIWFIFPLHLIKTKTFFEKKKNPMSFILKYHFNLRPGSGFREQ